MLHENINVFLMVEQGKLYYNICLRFSLFILFVIVINYVSIQIKYTTVSPVGVTCYIVQRDHGTMYTVYLGI